jgi:acetoin utilization deacetylase AcuC-like enzyme
MADSPINHGNALRSQTGRNRAYVNDSFCAHDPGPHPDQPARYAAVLAAIADVGWETADAPPAPIEAIARVHDRALIAGIEALSAAGGGSIDPDTVVSASSFDAALHACGGAMAAVDAVVDGDVAAAFSAGRPPGHHAEAGRAMGFCLFNQVAVAAAHARTRGVDRVAVLDWDVHHGNGTQAIFWDDPQVAYVSLHQYGRGFFPGTGAAGERGGPDAPAATVNVPLEAGTGDSDYLRAFSQVALPAVVRHDPGLVLVSAGFDAHVDDPLGSLRLSAAAFGTMATAVRDIGVPLAVVLEGGYDLAALRASVRETLAALSRG